jgi:DNA-directed RNA polymerase subunit RPC12/RpoP
MSRGEAMSGDELWFEEAGDELDDEEYPDEQDDEGTETVSCPECGAEVYEDAVRCPICGHYVTHDTSVWSGRPGWWVLLGLIGILAVIVMLAGLASC